MTRSRYRFFENEYPYFMTATIVAWLPVFAYPRFVDVIFESWRFLQRERDVRIFGFVVMENHLNWIATAPNISDQVGRFKSFTARRILDSMESLGFSTMLQELQHFKMRHKVDQTHQLWQEGSHPEQIQNGDMIRQ